MLISDFITESVLLDKNVDYHHELNPVAWQGKELRSVVKTRLLVIAAAFVEFLNLPNLKIKDTVLTGSNANYNWTKFSDFDVHIVVDFALIESEDVVIELFNAKKELWNSTHSITIKGHDVELYVENTATPPVSQGVYSLITDEWLREPSYHKPATDDAAIEAKVMDLMFSIDELIDSNSNDIDDYNRLAAKIKKMRQSGLSEKGEFSTENISYKILRNEGYITRLYDAKKDLQDQNLTLEQDMVSEMTMKVQSFEKGFASYVPYYQTFLETGTHIGDIENFAVCQSKELSHQYAVFDSKNIAAYFVITAAGELKAVYVLPEYRRQKLFSAILLFLKMGLGFKKISFGEQQSKDMRDTIGQIYHRFNTYWEKDGEKIPYDPDTTEQFYGLSSTGWKVIMENDNSFSTVPKFYSKEDIDLSNWYFSFIDKP